MSLTKMAVLEITDGSGTTAVFELDKAQTISATVDKTYLVGDRGQYLRFATRLVRDTSEFTTDQDTLDLRAGYWYDAGMGQWTGAVEFENGLEDVTWGDGSGGTGPGNVTQTDASGKGVDPLTRMQVLEYWIAQTRSDSFSQTRLHLGQWTDGNVDEADSAGVYGHPIPIAVDSFEGSKPEDDTASFTGTLQYHRVVPTPASADAADWINDHYSELLSPQEPTEVPDA